MKMKKNSPKVSIIIPVYNGEKFIKETIECALNQTYSNIEVIVINDGSCDETDKICKEFGNSIIYINKKNGGVSTALNAGINVMTGEYFSWLSHDDLYYPDKIEKQIRFIIENKLSDDSILYSGFDVIDEDGKILYAVSVDKDILNRKHYVLLRGKMNGITMLIPKRAFVECGMFDESLRCTQDYDLWWKFIKKYNFIYMDEICAKSRVHKNQQTNINPLMMSEGFDLWINMIEDVTDEEKIIYEGSIYNYYYEMAKYIINTPYVNVFNYLKEKLLLIDEDKYKKNPVKMPKKKFNDLLRFIKTHGIISLLKVAIQRIFKL